jgi:ankyrin repeat protein
MSHNDFIIAALLKNIEKNKVRRIAKLLRSERKKQLVRSMVTEQGGTPLHYAAHYSRPEIIQLLLEAGCSANTTITSGEFRGMTPLHAAAVAGNAECVKSLLDAYPDTASVRDGIGYTPYDYAVEAKFTECIEYFENQRAFDAAHTMIRLSAEK